MFFDKQPISAADHIISFVAEYYPDLSLSPFILEQLLWLQENSVITGQSHIITTSASVNIEVKRSLSRWYCLTLLENGSPGAWQRFIMAQSANEALSEQRFQELSEIIRGLSSSARECLMATCFITKSDAAELAVPVERRQELPTDSEQFITYLVTHFADTLPICQLLSLEAKALLPYAFYQNAHARHMLDMEGGYNMLSSMRHAIRNQIITMEQFNLWYARWIINIAGLNGHVSHIGSIYLTEPVAKGICILRQELQQLWSNPEHPVIDNYLAFRSQELAVSNNFVAWLGALMREHTPATGQAIQAWYDKLSEAEQQKSLMMFDQQLMRTRVTPTYKPTVLVNLRCLYGLTDKVLTIFTLIVATATQTHLAEVEAGKLSADTPLSFRSVAFKESLESIVAYYDVHHELPVLQIKPDGNLMIDFQPQCASSCSP